MRIDGLDLIPKGKRINLYATILKSLSLMSLNHKKCNFSVSSKYNFICKKAFSKSKIRRYLLNHIKVNAISNLLFRLAPGRLI